MMGALMTHDLEDVLVVLADVDRAIEKATKLDLAATVYLLKIASLDICMAAYGNEDAARSFDVQCGKSNGQRDGATRAVAHRSLRQDRKSTVRISE